MKTLVTIKIFCGLAIVILLGVVYCILWSKYLYFSWLVMMWHTPVAIEITSTDLYLYSGCLTRVWVARTSRPASDNCYTICYTCRYSGLSPDWHSCCLGPASQAESDAQHFPVPYAARPHSSQFTSFCRSQYPHELILFILHDYPFLKSAFNYQPCA